MGAGIITLGGWGSVSRAVGSHRSQGAVGSDSSQAGRSGGEMNSLLSALLLSRRGVSVTRLVLCCGTFRNEA